LLNIELLRKIVRIW